MELLVTSRIYQKWIREFLEGYKSNIKNFNFSYEDVLQECYLVLVETANNKQLTKEQFLKKMRKKMQKLERKATFEEFYLQEKISLLDAEFNAWLEQILSFNENKVFRLHYFYKLNEDEISKVLAWPKTYIHAIKVSALDKLKSQLSTREMDSYMKMIAQKTEAQPTKIVSSFHLTPKTVIKEANLGYPVNVKSFLALLEETHEQMSQKDLDLYGLRIQNDIKYFQKLAALEEKGLGNYLKRTRK